MYMYIIEVHVTEKGVKHNASVLNMMYVAAGTTSVCYRGRLRPARWFPEPKHGPTAAQPSNPRTSRRSSREQFILPGSLLDRGLSIRWWSVFRFSCEIILWYADSSLFSRTATSREVRAQRRPLRMVFGGRQDKRNGQRGGRPRQGLGHLFCVVVVAALVVPWKSIPIFLLSTFIFRPYWSNTRRYWFPSS